MDRLNDYKEKWHLSYGFLAKWLLIGLVAGGALGLLGLAESGLSINGISVWQGL